MATGESTFGGNWNDLIGEYASWVINVPAWNISSINVQDAINELDTEKVSASDSRIVHTTGTETISGVKSFTSQVNIPIIGTPTTLTNPTIQSTNSVDNFTQISIQNKNATVNSSADIIAYPNNNANDTTWFVDIGITSSVFSQAAYAITTPNDAYLFWSAVSGAGKLGNLVIATDSTGSNNSIIFWVNWFTALNKERMRLDGITGALSLWFSAVANGVLKLFSSANAFITTIQWGTLAANATLTLPNATSTLATTGLSETLTNKTITNPVIASIKWVVVTDTDGATITFDKNAWDFHRVILWGNRTLAVSNMAAGDKIVLDLVQDGTGNRTVTWFTTIKWTGWTVPTLTTTINKIDTFGFICTSAGNYQGYIIGQNL